MKISKLFILFCFCASIVNAQINIGGKPFSFNNQINIKKIIKNKKDKIILPPLDIEKIKIEDLKDKIDGIPPRFGYPFKVNLNLSNSGEWIEIENGDRLSPRCESLIRNALAPKTLFWISPLSTGVAHTPVTAKPQSGFRTAKP